MTDLATFGRDEFLAERWSYEAGEHVTFLGPTKSGKTTLAFQLLEHTATRDLPGVVLVVKPRDGTVTRWGKRTGFKRVHAWPPIAPWLSRPSGHLVWPKHTFDLDRDDAMLYQQMRAAIMDSYKRGNRIVFADELYGLSDLGLDRELITVWSRGRSMNTALWGATQRPTHVPLWAYSQAEHLFLFNDPDKRARDRFGEIGGVDPDLLRAEVAALKRHQCVYVRRDGPRMCIIDK